MIGKQFVNDAHHGGLRRIARRARALCGRPGYGQASDDDGADERLSQRRETRKRLTLAGHAVLLIDEGMRSKRAYGAIVRVMAQDAS